MLSSAVILSVFSFMHFFIACVYHSSLRICPANLLRKLRFVCLAETAFCFCKIPLLHTNTNETSFSETVCFCLFWRQLLRKCENCCLRALSWAAGQRWNSWCCLQKACPKKVVRCFLDLNRTNLKTKLWKTDKILKLKFGHEGKVIAAYRVLHWKRTAVPRRSQWKTVRCLASSLFRDISSVVGYCLAIPYMYDQRPIYLDFAFIQSAHALRRFLLLHWVLLEQGSKGINITFFFCLCPCWWRTKMFLFLCR